MKTQTRALWIVPPPKITQAWVKTQDGRRGHVWQWEKLPLEKQLERNLIVVTFDDGQPASYYTRDELEFEEQGSNA